MKRIWIIIALVGWVLSAAPLTFKKYPVASGRIVYSVEKTVDSDKVPGRYTGTRILRFDRYGYREWNEEKGEWNPGGGKEHSITYRVGTIMKMVDFSNRMIIEQNLTNQLEDIIRSSHGDLYRVGMAMLKRMGGKEDGNDTVLGYPCRIWIVPGGKKCFYKGIPLYEIQNTGHTHYRIKATKAEFGIPFKASDFALPPFQTVKLPTVSPSKPSAPSAAPKKGEEKSKSVEAIKRDLLEKKPAFVAARNCIANSHTLEAANRCIREFSKAVGESFDPVKSWSEADRTQALEALDSFIRGIDCAQKAKTREEIDACSPEF